MHQEKYLIMGSGGALATYLSMYLSTDVETCNKLYIIHHNTFDVGKKYIP